MVLKNRYNGILDKLIESRYSENKLSIYTNKVPLQKQLVKILGEPAKEHKIKRSIAGSTWEISLDDKSKISKMILKANIFEL